MSVMERETRRSQSEDRDKLTAEVRQRIEDAVEDRKRFEPTWHMALAYAAGKQWVEWSHRDRRVIMPPEVNPRDLYTADRITEYRTTALGELGSDRDKPQLLISRDDQWSEELQEAVNQGLTHAWDHEAEAERALAEKDRLVIDLGTAAIRCLFDPTKGAIAKREWPHVDDRPVYGDDALEAVTSAAENGRTLSYRDVREGRITWQVLGPWNLLPPPGIPHEKDFPYETIVRPALLEDVKALYPAASDLKEDTNIVNLLGLDSNTEMPFGRGYGDDDGSTGSQQRLKAHVWLYTHFVRPSAKHPKGRMIELAGESKRLLQVTDKVPYVGPSGDRRSGLAYFHWWRVTGRFWSRGLVEAMQEGQRRLNRRVTQASKTIDRGQPKVFIRGDVVRNVPTGMPLEVVELDKTADRPEFFEGIGPGEWMYRDVEQIDNDLAHATGLYGPSRGENPPNVDTYSQLALIAENDQTKREPIYRDHQDSQQLLVEDTVYDMRTYWGDEKRVRVSEDDESSFRSVVFNAAKIPDPEEQPDAYTVKVVRGSAKPRSQGALLQLVQDLKLAAAEAGLFQGPQWLEWYRDSLEAGHPLDFPEVAASDQEEVAELETHAIREGEDVAAAYWDDPEIHVPVHRMAQNQARLSGDVETFGRLEQHIQDHLAVAQAMQAQIAEQGGGTLPTDDTLPPEVIPEPEVPAPGQQSTP